MNATEAKNPHEVGTEEAALWDAKRQGQEPKSTDLKVISPPKKDSKPTDRRKNQTKDKPTPKPLLTRMSDVEPEEVSWLWHPYIPLGKLTLLEGDPGTMKTFIALAIIAAITRGEPLPGQNGLPVETCKPANALYLTAEDGLADTIRTRLDAADADVSRVFVLTGGEIEKDDGKRYETAVTLADVPLLEAALKKVSPKILVLDPLMAYLGAGVDAHRSNETRPLLAKLGNLAEKYGCAVVGIRHFNKSLGGKALYSGLGSIDFIAASRSALHAGEHEGQRILAHAKASLAPKGASLLYDVQDGALIWLGVADDVTADDMRALPVARRNSDEGERAGALERAVSFLGKFLKDGAQPAKAVEAEAKRERISTRTLNRAKAELGVQSFRLSSGNEGEGVWSWSL